MRSKYPLRKSPSPHHREQSPAPQLRWKEEIELEIQRLETVLRDPLATEQHKALVLSQIAGYQEFAAGVLTPPADWLRQMHLLAE